MSTPVKKVPIHLQSAQNRLLIRHGKVVNEDGTTDDDIYIEDGVIKHIGKNLIIPGGTRVIDARGRYVMPGGIDPHTHFEFQFMGTCTADNYYQGTKAAVAGGTTCVINFAIPDKGQSVLDAYYDARQRADPKVCCDYSLHMGVTSWSNSIDKDMEILTKEHGINSFKMFMTYSLMLNDEEIYSVFEKCKKLGALPMVHCENGLIIKKNAEKLLAQGITGPEGHELSRPEEVEAEAVNRACVIANQVDTPLYIVHVMSKSAGLALDAARKKNNKKVFGETLAAGVGCDGSHCNHECFDHAAGYILSPPLRPDPATPKTLMTFLAQDILQTTGSDHCTFTKSQKEIGRNDFRKIPNGVNGVEERMSVIWEKGVHSGIIDPNRFVAITSTNAAKIFNLYPRKGCIAVGSDADIVIWNPNATKVISAKTHNIAIELNVFEGMECHGVPEYVIVNGRIIVDDGQLKAVEGHGRFIETPVYAPYVYDIENADSIKPPKVEHFVDNELTEPKKHPLKKDMCPTPTLPESAISTPSCKGPRPEGQRNIQDSTFSITEELDLERKSCIRVKNPPGGKSSGFW
ncbi:dihydropyrimidinase isoform X1 [Coccinella septempunctata]|uniref:dihydropyrimidinase isoform X1 n=1 Tax=Coccinella septempunctata TaxID=41139 RepID=UPI001D060EA1|nr:dihydropyrimidinase isoform X1 [Coccinella septempunctata]